MEIVFYLAIRHLASIGDWMDGASFASDRPPTRTWRSGISVLCVVCGLGHLYKIHTLSTRGEHLRHSEEYTEGFSPLVLHPGFLFPWVPLLFHEQ